MKLVSLHHSPKAAWTQGCFFSRSLVEYRQGIALLCYQQTTWSPSADLKGPCIGQGFFTFFCPSQITQVMQSLLTSRAVPLSSDWFQLQLQSFLCIPFTLTWALKRSLERAANAEIQFFFNENSLPLKKKSFNLSALMCMHSHTYHIYAIYLYAYICKYIYSLRLWATVNSFCFTVCIKCMQMKSRFPLQSQMWMWKIVINCKAFYRNVRGYFCHS